MDILDDLNGSEEPNAEAQTQEPQANPATEEAAPVTDEAQPETPEQKRERDERGRFKAKDEPVMVPLQALHETRDELKALKAQLEAMRQPEAQQQAPQVPDMFENPEGYAAFIQSQISSVTLNDRLNTSEELVRQSAGDETVNAAQEWGKQVLASNPAFAQAFYAQRNPYGFLVKEYQRHQTAAQIGDDPKTIQEFLAWKAAQTTSPQAIPTSLADQQSARGGAVPYQPPSLEELLKG